jgi:thioredoxin 1
LITELSDENFEKFLSSNEIAVVDFYSNWCPPCRIMDPVYKGLSGELDGSAGFARLNISRVSEIPGRFGIGKIPTFVIFRNGEEVDRLVGVKPKSRLSARIRSVIEEHQITPRDTRP